MKDGYGREIRYMRLSVTELCNLRCRYCMPQHGITKKAHSDILSEEELVEIVKVGSRLGIKKVRITGGEPLVKRNILSICRSISDIEGIEELCLTTNGTLLAQKAEQLKNSGVSRLNISLDTLREDRYKYITRHGNITEVFKGIESALNAGFKKVKINTVLMKGVNDDEISDMVNLTSKYPLDIRFIELMPINAECMLPISRYMPCTEVLKIVPKLYPVENTGSIEKSYRYPGAKGTVGLITPVSDHFCSRCDRIRITADGMIKPCLFSECEYSIKNADKDTIEETLRSAIAEKPACHGNLLDNGVSLSKRTMNRIGG